MFRFTRLIAAAFFLIPCAFSQNSNRVKAAYDLSFYTSIPHIAAGWQWSTELYFSGAEEITLSLHSDDPTHPFVVKGQEDVTNGQYRVNGLAPLVIVSRDGSFAQGWANFYSSNGGVNLHAFAILRNTIAQNGFMAESLIPAISTSFGGDYPSFNANPIKMIFDNTGNYATSVALVNADTADNPSYATMPVTVTIADEGGNVIATHYLDLTREQHVAYTLKDQFPETAGKRGTIAFSTPFVRTGMPGFYPPPLCILGQRFTIMPNGSQSFATIPLFQ